MTPDHRRHVFLDLEGNANGTVFVIVASPTGVVYQVQGAGSRGLTWPPSLLDLDESRLAEADEAWVPVLTPDGPGVLTWENSDWSGLWGRKGSTASSLALAVDWSGRVFSVVQRSSFTPVRSTRVHQ
ncbi:DUF6210 family protein [Streptomyces sp. NPDC047072]|uniref:DUF6210 family protein n=1 Tax=Streptomyces sp. NPDC047072 TaxID=3154809 RepID=UPI0033CCAA1B